MSKSAEHETILVVDDVPDTLEVVQRNLVSQGYKVFTARNVPEAIEVLESTHVELVITDLKMPKISGLDLIRHVRENFKDTEVMMITGYASIKGAVEAVKYGAEEYLAKPFTDEELFNSVQTTLLKRSNKKSVQVVIDEKYFTKYGLLGECDSMKKLYKVISKVSASSANVLITGESGTGKELIARAIHYGSPRASAPFLPVNCGGIPENLLESELFGYVKGAFTGAFETRYGFFQSADGGTIFLDEISETSMAMQVKLLRALQDKEIFMVGANKGKKVDVRIVAATNKDLLSLVKKEIFREDLYFRLNVITVNIPPLRERGDDVLILIKNFTEKYARECGIKSPVYSEKALNLLRHYYWPGNVRELENVVQRLVVMTENDIIDAPDLPTLMRYSLLKENNYTRTLAEVEYEYITKVLESVKGNKTQAAEILGIDRKTLREKLKCD